jgi:hypothetical protein
MSKTQEGKQAADRRKFALSILIPAATVFVLAGLGAIPTDVGV